jgi:hypothetical protein
MSGPGLCGEGTNPRFFEVQQNLDTGGNFYLYMDVKDVLKELVETLEDTFEEVDLSPEMEAGFQIARSVIDALGLYGIEDVGLSYMNTDTMAISKGFLRIPGGGDGIFSVLGGPAHPCTMLDYAPADTGMFVTFDVDLARFLDLARDIAQKVGGPDLLVEINKQIRTLNELAGLDVEKILRSLGGTYTVYFRLHPTDTLTLPGMGEDGADLIIPAPQLAFAIAVKDGDLYDTLLDKLLGTGLVNPDERDQKDRQFDLTIPPNDVYSASPQVVEKDNILFITTHTSYLESLLAKPGEEGLRSQADFVALTEGLPMENNELAYVSQAFSEKVNPLVLKLVSITQGDLPEEASESFNEVMRIAQQNVGQAGVRVNRPDGLWWAAQTTRKADQMFPLMAAVVSSAAGALIGIQAAEGAFGEDEEAGKEKVTSDLRLISVALESYYIDYQTYPTSATLEELLEQGPGGEANRIALEPLTKPTAYITEIPNDPYSETETDDVAPYCYFAPTEAIVDGEGDPVTFNFVLWSVGPDGLSDINSIEDLIDALDPESSLHYNPAQESEEPAGDIIRFSE